ncbi:hypothetical protein ACFFJT_20530 [Dyella flava]|uniref:PXPV repeat-containing protein n=1 Tax=Dyella flava TaxID=1920170 RepID=A0ABS2K0B9_9GAMM|nr:hypothetical protein [Dyella flava]MBM7124697.1 hypothetical protein [Dyella flava]GLQ49351.1 hypothetical protein GCM10010872_08000 [Dyella flava]
MNKTPYLLASLLAVGIGAYLPSAHAAAVVTYSSAPGYAVTTVHTTGPYYGIHPAPCCYTGVVVTGRASTITVAAVPPPPPLVRMVYAAPVVTVYPPPRVVYVPTAYYVP